MLDPRQRSIVDRVLDREETNRTHLVVALSGAHAYGFPSPDSDFDLKGVHVLPTERWLGLHTPDSHASRMEIIDGVEVDYSSNEIRQVLAGVLNGNGNYIERILGPHLLRTHPLLAELQPLVRNALSRRVLNHYRGFSTGQLRELERGINRSAKQVLYVLRTAMTGIHLLRTGLVEPSLAALASDDAEIAELILLKQRGERIELDAARLEHWLTRLRELQVELEAAAASSCLPAEPPNETQIEDWLIALRRNPIS